MNAPFKIGDKVSRISNFGFDPDQTADKIFEVESIHMDYENELSLKFKGDSFSGYDPKCFALVPKSELETLIEKANEGLKSMASLVELYADQVEVMDTTTGQWRKPHPTVSASETRIKKPVFEIEVQYGSTVKCPVELIGNQIKIGSILKYEAGSFAFILGKILSGYPTYDFKNLYMYANRVGIGADTDGVWRISWPECDKLYAFLKEAGFK